MRAVVNYLWGGGVGERSSPRSSPSPPVTEGLLRVTNASEGYGQKNHSSFRDLGAARESLITL
jgi:hypothetical protein